MPSELRYCENCGDIIQVRQGESVNVAERFICESCRGGGSGRASRTEGRKPAEFGKESGNLELFSTTTISFHQREFESLAMEHDDGPLQPGGRGAEPEPERPLMFVDTDAPSHPHGSTTGGPAPTARRIVFRCMHCRATLCIRPVKATSRLSCPYCSKSVYITQSGQLVAKPPSAAFRQGSAALPEIRPGSVALKRKPDAGEAAATAPKGKKDRRAPSPSKMSETDRGPSVTVSVEEPAEPHPRSLAPPRAESPEEEAPSAGGISGFDEDLRRASPTTPPKAPGLPAPRPPDYARRRTAARPASPKTARRQRPPQPHRTATVATNVDESIAAGRRPGRRAAPSTAAVPTFGRKLLCGFFVAFTVTLPVGLLGTMDKVAGARGTLETAPDAPPTLFEKLGNIALRGMENLLGGEER